MTPGKNSSKKSTAKKSGPSKTRRTSKKRRGIFKAKTIKPKVKLDSGKVVALCTSIVVCCTLLLVVTVLIPSGGGTKNAAIENEIQKTENSQKTPEKSRDSSVSQKRDESRSAPGTKSKNENKTENREDEAERLRQEEARRLQREEQKKKDREKQRLAEEQERLLKQEQQERLLREREEAEKREFADFPAAKNNAKLVFIFDDGGYNVSQLKKVLSLPFPVTVAVLPKLAHSKECGALVRSSGNEVMLHQPMQSVNLSVNPGPGAISPEMSVEEIRAVLRENIAEVGPVSGLNNHEGSLITEDEIRIGAVMQAADELGIYFLDSRTTSQTRVPQVAMGMGYGYYQRDIFLDNEKTKENIVAEVKKGLDIANKKGCAVMIGHVWSADILPDVLRQMYPVLVEKGYSFCSVSKSGSLVTP